MNAFLWKESFQVFTGKLPQLKEDKMGTAKCNASQKMKWVENSKKVCVTAAQQAVCKVYENRQKKNIKTKKKHNFFTY